MYVVFNAVFKIISVISGGQCTYPCFPGVVSPVLRTIFFLNHWLLSYITVVETMGRGERGMNPVALIMIYSRKEYWPIRGSKERSPVLKCANDGAMQTRQIKVHLKIILYNPSDAY